MSRSERLRSHWVCCPIQIFFVPCMLLKLKQKHLNENADIQVFFFFFAMRFNAFSLIFLSQCTYFWGWWGGRDHTFFVILWRLIETLRLMILRYFIFPSPYCINDSGQTFSIDSNVFEYACVHVCACACLCVCFTSIATDTVSILYSIFFLPPPNYSSVSFGLLVWAQIGYRINTQITLWKAD